MARSEIISLRSLLVALIMLAVGALVLAGHAQLLYYGSRPLPYRIAGDSDAYIKIASGHLAEVESPFSKRILYPFLVGSVARLLHADLGVAFLAANFLCFGLLAYCVAACLENTVGRPFLALIPLGTAFGFESLSLAYLPDLFHAAFTCLFFLLLLKEQRGWALVTLFFLCLARDNTFFLCAVFAVVAWLRRDGIWKAVLGVLGLGVIVSSIMARGGKPNIHHLAEPLYLAFKVPYNLLGNLTGVFFWTDMRPELGTPFFSRPIPPFFRHFAQDSQIGIVLDPHQALNTYITLLTIFGTGPVFLWFLRRQWKSVPTSLPVQLALVYGILSYFLGVALGNWVFRLVGYGWPAFWIALPFLLARLGYRPPPWKTTLLLACFWTSTWLPSLLQESAYRWTLILPLAVIFDAITVALLLTGRGDFRPTAAPEASSAKS